MADLIITNREDLVAIANAVRANSDITDEISIDGIVSGINYVAEYVAANTNNGIDTSDATASADEIMQGETAYVDGEKITGSFTIENELTTQDNLISQIQTALQNKAAGSEPVLQDKTVTPSTSTQTATPDSGYDGLSKVTVNPIPSDYIVPSGTKTITTNGTHDVKAYASATVNVAGEDVTDETTAYTDKLATLETAITALETELQGKASGGGSGGSDTSSITGYCLFIGNNITTIEELGVNDYIISVIIGDSVESIGGYAFYGFNKLKNVNFGNNVTDIGMSAFEGRCLSNIVLPNSVVNIGDGAFYQCSCLTSVTIQNSVMSIGALSFANCYELVELIFTGTMAQWNSISKGDDWNGNVPATYVQCSDGTVSL